jgi:hypothetical protein
MPYAKKMGSSGMEGLLNFGDINHLQYFTDMKWIRKYYKVPAKRGGKVRFCKTKIGTIKSARNGYLRVVFDGYKNIVSLHPTWNIEYI